MKGDANPKGLKMELITDNMLRRVGDESRLITLNPNLSVLTHQLIPNARSVGRSAVTKSSPLSSLARSSTGITSITARLLLVHLVRWKPPLLHNSVMRCMSDMASSSLATDSKGHQHNNS